MTIVTKIDNHHGRLRHIILVHYDHDNWLPPSLDRFTGTSENLGSIGLLPTEH